MYAILDLGAGFGVVRVTIVVLLWIAILSRGFGVEAKGRGWCGGEAGLDRCDCAVDELVYGVYYVVEEGLVGC